MIVVDTIFFGGNDRNCLVVVHSEKLRLLIKWIFIYINISLFAGVIVELKDLFFFGKDQ